DADRLRQRLFLGQLIEFRVGRTGIFAIVLFLLDADDVGRALVAGKEIFSVFRVEKFSKRLNAADDEEKIVLAFKSEYGVHKIVPRALIAELDFQAVGEESDKVGNHLIRMDSHTCLPHSVAAACGM